MPGSETQQHGPFANTEEMMQFAIERGLWFFWRMQHLWFSPKELRAKWNRGDFCWGVTNWELRDPNIQIVEIDREITALQDKREAIAARIRGEHE